MCPFLEIVVVFSALCLSFESALLKQSVFSYLPMTYINHLAIFGKIVTFFS